MWMTALNPNLTQRTGVVLPFGPRGISELRAGVLEQILSSQAGPAGHRRLAEQTAPTPLSAPGLADAQIQSSLAQAEAFGRAAQALASSMVMNGAGVMALGDDRFVSMPGAPCPGVGSIPGVLCQAAKIMMQGRPVIAKFGGLTVSIPPPAGFPHALSNQLSGSEEDDLGAARRMVKAAVKRRIVSGGRGRGRGVPSRRGRRAAPTRGRGKGRVSRPVLRPAAVPVTPSALMPSSAPPVITTIAPAVITPTQVGPAGDLVRRPVGFSTVARMLPGVPPSVSPFDRPIPPFPTAVPPSAVVRPGGMTIGPPPPIAPGTQPMVTPTLDPSKVTSLMPSYGVPATAQPGAQPYAQPGQPGLIPSAGGPGGPQDYGPLTPMGPQQPMQPQTPSGGGGGGGGGGFDMGPGPQPMMPPMPPLPTSRALPVSDEEDEEDEGNGEDEDLEGTPYSLAVYGRP